MVGSLKGPALPHPGWGDGFTFLIPELGGANSYPFLGAGSGAGEQGIIISRAAFTRMGIGDY